MNFSQLSQLSNGCNTVPRKSNYMPSIKMQKLVSKIKTILNRNKTFLQIRADITLQ